MSSLTIRLAVSCLLVLLFLPGCGNTEKEPSEGTESIPEVDIKKESPVALPEYTEGAAEKEGPHWQLSPYGEPSVITSTTTAADLIKMYGEESIQTSAEITMTEGEVMPGAILFPDDPTQRLEMIWNDPTNQSSPFRAILRKGSTKWQLPHGLGIGISLDSLEQLNGKPISLLGFGWDYEGTIVDWNNGHLTALRAPQGGIMLRLELDPKAFEKLHEKEKKAVSGDQTLLSNLPTLAKLNLKVSEIIMEYRGSSNKDFAR